MDTQLSQQTAGVCSKQTCGELSLDTTDVPLSNCVSGIINPANIEKRVLTVDEIKRSEWRTGLAWLR